MPLFTVVDASDMALETLIFFIMDLIRVHHYLRSFHSYPQYIVGFKVSIIPVQEWELNGNIGDVLLCCIKALNLSMDV